MEQNRFFTLEEANRLLPWLERRLRRIGSLRADLERLHKELQSLMRKGRGDGHNGVEQEMTAKRREFDAVADQLAPLIPEIRVDLGIVMQDPDRGVVDFPFLRGGREVYLCWSLGEDQIRFWHEVDAGFAGRQFL